LLIGVALDEWERNSAIVAANAAELESI
jgi:hypothetical protein